MSAPNRSFDIARPMKFTASAPDGKYKHIYVCFISQKIFNFDKKYL